jgi:hypothetical protein
MSRDNHNFINKKFKDNKVTEKKVEGLLHTNPHLIEKRSAQIRQRRREQSRRKSFLFGLRGMFKRNIEMESKS